MSICSFIDLSKCTNGRRQVSQTTLGPKTQVFNCYIPLMNVVRHECRLLGHSWPTPLCVWNTSYRLLANICYIFIIYILLYILYSIFYLYLLTTELSFICDKSCSGKETNCRLFFWCKPCKNFSKANTNRHLRKSSC